MKKNVINEINDMKYLFTYNRGRLLSEQEKYEGEDIDIEDTEIDDFDDEDEDEDFNYLKGEMEEEFDMPTMSPGTKEKQRTKEKERTKERKHGTPYQPKPGPKPDPKAGRKGDMPDWLTFDELGIDFE